MSTLTAGALQLMSWSLFVQQREEVPMSAGHPPGQESSRDDNHGQHGPRESIVLAVCIMTFLGCAASPRPCGQRCSTLLAPPSCWRPAPASFDAAIEIQYSGHHGRNVYWPRDATRCPWRERDVPSQTRFLDRLGPVGSFLEYTGNVATCGFLCPTSRL